MDNDSIKKELEEKIEQHIKSAQIQSEDNDFVENIIRCDLLQGAKFLSEILLNDCLSEHIQELIDVIEEQIN